MAKLIRPRGLAFGVAAAGGKDLSAKQSDIISELQAFFFSSKMKISCQIEASRRCDLLSVRQMSDPQVTLVNL